ncbi:hypothetical protein A3728_18390 [Sulfitobacter sp. HI0040]|nr:hypothetical protein A3728_18390 [Sulfitobacter sp. HI0040]KZZ66525.1 hypothetical protein A3764_16800 [Sulfitobacter sp. HI0129]
MRIGVTGSRYPRPNQILDSLRRILIEKGATELHHGDCLGFDAQAHDLAASMGIRTVAHPPQDPRMRAFKDADEIRSPLPYLDRNRNIVAESEYIVAAPDGPERVRSGTWATVRYAKRTRVRGIVLADRTKTDHECVADCVADHPTGHLSY